MKAIFTTGFGMAICLTALFLTTGCKKETPANTVPTQDWTCTCTDQNGTRASRTITNTTRVNADSICDSYEFHTGAYYSNCAVQ